MNKRVRMARLLFFSYIGLLTACGNPNASQTRTEAAWNPPTRNATESRGAAAPIAYWKNADELGRGRPVDRTLLEGTLMEAAGPRALQEVLVDAALERRLEELRLIVTDQRILEERMLLLQALDEDEDRAIRLLETVRRREGLGPIRFSSLLRRNAALRMLIRDDVRPNEESVRAAWDARHGPRRTARVFVGRTPDACSEVIARVQAGEDFALLAARGSTDASASAGGLIEPISRLDPSWPTAFRETLWTTPLTKVSAPVLVDGNYVVILPLEEVPGDGTTLETARSDSERRVRLAQERLLMDGLARDLLGSLQVEIIDGDLDRAWRTPAP